MRQENCEGTQETKVIIEIHKDKEPEKFQTTLSQLKETMDVHKDVSLLEILKEKQRISEIIEYFDIYCVSDEETQVNIMTKETWKTLLWYLR
jgi:hypothetical protein